MQCLPSASRDAGRLAARLGLPLHRDRRASLSRRRNASDGRPGRRDDNRSICSLDRPNDKLIALLFAAEALRRGGARRLVLVAPYLCYMRQDAAFHAGEAISQKVIGPLLARMRSTASSPSTRICTARTTSATYFPASRPRISRPCRQSPRRCAARSIRGRSSSGRTQESAPWVGDLAGRLGLAAYGRHARRAPATARSRSRSPRPVSSKAARCCWSTTSSPPAARSSPAPKLSPPPARRVDRLRRHPRAVSAGDAAASSSAPAFARCARRQRAASHQRHRARRPVSPTALRNGEPPHEPDRPLLRRRAHRHRLVPSVRDRTASASWSTAACSRATRR